MKLTTKRAAKSTNYCCSRGRCKQKAAWIQIVQLGELKDTRGFCEKHPPIGAW